MSTASQAEARGPRRLASGLGFALAAGVPLCAYLVTLSGSSYWLDGGEMVAAGVALDIAHPPGHPLTGVYGKLWTLLPLGSLAFRVALGQAVAAALAAWFLFRACRTVAGALGAQEPAAFALGLGGAWLWALSFGVWFQAVRPEVYALQALVLLVTIDALLRVQLSGGEDTRALYVAAFALGLGLTNHHLMAFLLFPALGFGALVVARRCGAWPIARSAGLGLLALLTYVYLPVRAATQPPANFGAPVTLERFIWVLTARVYAKNVGGHDDAPFGERFGDLTLALIDDLHALPLLIAALGAYALLRSERGRGAGVTCLLIAASVIGTRGWLGSVRGNPDALGYAIGGTAALALLASAGIAALVDLAAQHARGRLPGLALAAACALAALGGQLGTTFARADLSSFHATDAFDELRVRALPPRSVVIATTPQAVFRQLELALTEVVRPDLTLVPVPFLGYPGVAEALTRAHPELSPLVERFAAQGQIQPEPLMRLASRRPVLTELDAHVAPRTYRALLPAGVLYAVVDPRVVNTALPRARGLQLRIEARLDALLGKDAAEAETAHQLLWVHYVSALYYAALGHPELARKSVAKAALLFPRDSRVTALQRALATQRKPLDIRPFIATAVQ